MMREILVRRLVPATPRFLVATAPGTQPARESVRLFVKAVPVARLAEDAFHAHVLASVVTRRQLSRIQQEVSRIFLTRPRPSSPEPTILNLPSLIKRFLQPSPVTPIRL